MTGAAATQLAQDLLANCPTSRYLIVSQPHVNVADLTTSWGKCAVPNLYRAMGREAIQTTTSVAEVFGTMSAQDLAGFVRTTCALAGKDVHVAQVVLPELPATSKGRALEHNGMRCVCVCVCVHGGYGYERQTERS
jgi:hypothetical protein